MEIFLNLTLIVASLLIFFVFKKMKSLISKQGGVLIILSAYLLGIKVFLLSDFKSLGFRLDNINDTLLPTIIFTMLSIAILSVMRFRTRKFKVIKWFLSLLTLYLFFGILQQAFFQSVFTHTLKELLNNNVLVVIFSGVFYSAFHWDWRAKELTFGFLTLFAGVVWAILFLSSPNIILLGVSHAILASLYYFIVHKDNVLKERADSIRKKDIVTKLKSYEHKSYKAGKWIKKEIDTDKKRIKSKINELRSR